MGWCSGTEIFDEIVVAVNDIGLSRPKQRVILEALRDVMENHDWDCQPDSEFYDDEFVGEILGNPFEEE